MFDAIVNQANDAILVAEVLPDAGPGFRIIYTNDAFTRIFGYSNQEVLGRSPRMLQGPDTCADTIKEISEIVHRGLSIRRRILNYTKEGREVWVDVNIVPLPSSDGRIRSFAAIERDATTDVQREHQLEEFAYGDPLTKLANRRYFDLMLDRELARAGRTPAALSLALLDIDRFKAVNDTCGHPVGDRVLVAVARAMLQSIRNYDYVARIGGEEFAVLLPGAGLADGARIAERICAQIRSDAHVVVGTERIAVTCSAGVVALKGPGMTGEAFMSGADRALYMAKNAGRDRVVALDLAPQAAAAE